MKKLERSLSHEGQAEFGHIFKDGYIPVKEWTPIYANLQGHPDGEEQLVFLVEWTRLSEEQQSFVLDYLSKKFQFPKASRSQIHNQLETDGYLPIQHKWVIENYDLRHFI